MPKRTVAAVFAASAALAAGGCGSSGSEHPVRPLTARPPATSRFQKLTTPEEKIRFIESSGAPQSEKDKAIARVRSGQL